MPSSATQSRPSAASIMLTFLALAYMLSMFDRLLMVVLAEMVKEEFLLSDKQLSILTGAAFVIVYGASAIGAGWLIDQYSRKKILIWSLSIWSVMTVACGFAQSFAQLAFARAGVGVGEAASVPVGLSSINDMYKPEKRPMAVAILFTGGTLGTLSCFLLGSWIAVNYGWRMAFYISGPLGFLLVILIARFAREPTRQVIPNNHHSDTSSFALMWNNKPLLWLITAGAISTFGNLGMMQWLPIFFMRSHDLSLSQIGLFFGPVVAGGMASGMMFGGWIGNRIAKKSNIKLVILSGWSLLILIPMYLFLLWTPSLVTALIMTFFATALSVVYSPNFTSAWQTICDPRACGTTAGVSGFINSLTGGALCTFAVGMLSDYWSPVAGVDSLRYALMVGMIFCLMGATLFFYSAHKMKKNMYKPLGYAEVSYD